MSPDLRFQGVEKRYGKVVALAGIDLDVESGSVLAILGPNGAGKSTLFGCMLGWTLPTGGAITWRGEPLGDQARRRCGYTPERVALYWNQSVWENGLFFAGLRGRDGRELEWQLRRLNLFSVRDRRTDQLSKGMLQRLGLAIALCGEPELIVLDEPFNGLDPALLEDLGQVLLAEQARGATLLISTHTISAIEPLASHVAILLQGKLAAHGAIEELRRSHPDADSLECIYHRVARRQRRGATEEVPA